VLENAARTAVDESSRPAQHAEPVVRVEDLSVRLSLQRESVLSLRETVVRFLERRPVETEEFWPLRNVSFTASRGEVFGIVGRNGAGKSTLLKVVAGVITPTLGRVEARGRVAPLLELGAGFDTDLTGRENVYLYASLLGFPRKAIDERFDRIIAFAELERFVDVPLKNYSSGMSSRLAFAVATDVDAEVLIVDEALTVGDSRFQAKCMERIDAFRRRGVTILFVSHSPDQVRRLCSNALWLDQGEARMLGPASEVVDAYVACEYEPPQRRSVSWPRPQRPGLAAETGDGGGVSVSYRSPVTPFQTPPAVGEYDFVDISLAHEHSTEHLAELFGGRGLCVSNNRKIVDAARSRGVDSVFADPQAIDFPDGSVRFVSLVDSPILLPSLGAVHTVVERAARWARDFVFVRMVSYEDEDYLRSLGLKFYWHEWTDCPMHPRVDQLAAIFESLGLEQYHISYRDPALSSEAPAILPVDAPPDQGAYDPDRHGPKPSVVFPRPIYGQIDIFIALRRFDVDEWHDIITTGTWS
jgi:ABC-type polysaccharide/polyol phosphate transport system ATPase subunit